MLKKVPIASTLTKLGMFAAYRILLSPRDRFCDRADCGLSRIGHLEAGSRYPAKRFFVQARRYPWRRRFRVHVMVVVPMFACVQQSGSQPVR